MTTRPCRIVSVPSGHPYPRAIRSDLSTAFAVRDDPDPTHPDRPAGRVWWPHLGLEPQWLDQQELDLLHIHFGFDHRSPAQLAELVDHLRSRGRALVLTVHDLRSPHQQDSSTLDRQLDVLVPSADAIITLTPWAADQIERRWRRTALVSPHPPLVALDDARRLRESRRRRTSQRPVVAMSCKSLRANCDPVRLLPALERAARITGARLRVLVHSEVVSRPEPAHAPAVAALLRARERGVELVVHEPLSDRALWSELAAQDVAVLPYRFGTHSGWLEACHDVGTFVVAPSFGGYLDQGADGVYRADADGHDDGLDDGLDEHSLIEAVGTSVERARSGMLAGGEPADRAQRTTRAAALHEQVYRQVLRTTDDRTSADRTGAQRASA